MKLLKKIFCIALTLLITLCVAGCGDSYQDAVIYFEAPTFPYSVDPQTASSNEELVIVNNIYEGLLRKNASGAIVCGVSQSFSKKGLTYTFKLREDAVWSNEEPLTAYDFVFALRRAVSPKTKAPFVSRLFCIENAKAIYEGKKSISTLGVSASNSTTLTIKLSYDDKSFEETLTTSIAMPCNEEFFNSTAGKYGLSRDTTISCGSYRLAKWNKESFGIRLYANSLYTGTFPAKNSAVYISKDKEKTAYERLVSGSTDITFIDSSMSEEVKALGIKTSDFQNICWFLTISPEFSNDMRKSLALLTGSEVFGKDLKSGYTAADSLFPSAVKEKVGSVGMTFYNIDTAKSLFTKEVEKLPDKKFPSGTKLYYYDNGVIKSTVTDIVGHWQNHLGAFVNIEPVDNIDALLTELKNQTLSMAIFPLTAGSNNLTEYISNFGVNYNGENLTDVQTSILKANRIFPIAFQNTTVAYSSELSDVFTRLGNGYIDFSFIVKTE